MFHFISNLIYITHFKIKINMTRWKKNNNKKKHYFVAWFAGQFLPWRRGPAACYAQGCWPWLRLIVRITYTHVKRSLLPWCSHSPLCGRLSLAVWTRARTPHLLTHGELSDIASERLGEAWRESNQPAALLISTYEPDHQLACHCDEGQAFNYLFTIYIKKNEVKKIGLYRHTKS